MFWQGVEIATQMVIAQIDPTAVPDEQAIEQMILAQWLEAYIEAGTA